MSPNPLLTQLDIGGIWHIGVFFGIAFCTLFLLWKNRESLGYLTLVLWGYVLISALFTIEYPIVRYGVLNPVFQVTSGQVFLELLVIPLTVLSVGRGVWNLVSLTVAIETICIWTGEGRGLLGWLSFDLAFIALCLPFVPIWLMVPILITVLTHHGTTALMIISAQIFAICLKRRRKEYFGALGLVLVVFAFVAHRHQLNAWFDSGERLAIYKRFMGYWLKDWNYRRIFLGSGPGSFMWVSLVLSKYEPPLWLQMHCEYLQILFENGVVGLVLVLAFIGKTLKSSWRDERTLAGVLGMVVFGLTYHPLRFFPSAFVCALIVYEAQIKLSTNGGDTEGDHRESLASGDLHRDESG